MAARKTLTVVREFGTLVRGEYKSWHEIITRYIYLMIYEKCEILEISKCFMDKLEML